MSTVQRLPGPVIDRWEWQRRGACRGRDSAQFFHPDGERGSSRTRREEAAKVVCRGCPVRPECAAHALVVREPYGVWGGFTETERLVLLPELGWEDLVDRQCGRADVRGLEERLHRIRPDAYRQADQQLQEIIEDRPASPVVPRQRAGLPAHAG